ncbi:MAG: hypothetical protein KDE54_26915 [Caldilineaceae bacterium]|nr:hypothetical protein [Caldilineaceae bacterium]MCB0141341.1 hypothetical protein [Caldilineaceae bacterium]
MTTKSAFTDAEWKTLMQAPFVAGMYITMADPSLGDSFKESVAVASKVAKTARSASGTELLVALAGEFSDFSNAAGAKPEFSARDVDAIKAEALADVKAAATLLQQKATAAEAAEISQWLYDMGLTAAEAAKEGDFLGIGGVRVSDAEKAALAHLAQALGVSV